MNIYPCADQRTFRTENYELVTAAVTANAAGYRTATSHNKLAKILT